MESSLMDNLTRLVFNYPAWTYFIIALGIILQGEITVLLSMYLIADDDISFKGFILTVFIAFFIAETLIYFLGKNSRNTKIGQKIRKKIPYGDKIESYIKSNVFKVLIVSKFIIGSTIIIMFMAGWTDISFRKFIKAQALSVAIWLPIVSIIAFSLVYGLWYLKSAKTFTRVELGIAVIAIIMIGSEYFFKKILKAGIALEEKAEKIGKKNEEKTKNLTK